jgi:hypothetical protein
MIHQNKCACGAPLPPSTCMSQCFNCREQERKRKEYIRKNNVILGE